jgi:hypothetical protein
MPFGWLIRILGSVVLFRWLSKRRGAVPKAALNFDSRKLRVQMRALTADALAASHLAVALAAASISLLISVVAVTLLILGPQWLGLVAAAFALAAWGFAGIEVRRFVRGAQMRRWRRRHVIIDGNDEATQAH